MQHLSSFLVEGQPRWFVAAVGISEYGRGFEQLPPQLFEIAAFRARAAGRRVDSIGMVRIRQPGGFADRQGPPLTGWLLPPRAEVADKESWFGGEQLE